ncbi:MAG: hypothetical protein ACI33P_10340 [Lysinibacillus sp.]
MKKLLLATGILCLAGCTEDERPQAADEDMEAVLVDEVGAQEQPAPAADEITHQQLLDVLEDVAYRFGVMKNNSSFQDGLYGLAHAGLIDVNQDGQDELYMLFRSSSYHKDELEHRNQEGYILEVWQADQETGRAAMLHSEFIDPGSSAPADMSVSFVTTLKGEVVLKNSRFQSDGQENFDESTYYAYRDGAFEQVLKTYHSAGGQEEHQLDGKKVDRKAFEQRLEDYEGEEAPLVRSEAGEKEFAFDASDISATIGQVFADLMEGFDTVPTDGEQASGEVLAKIREGMSDFTFYRTIDKRDPATFEAAISSIIVKGQVPQDGGDLGYFMGYKEETIMQQMKALHDIDLDAAALNLPSARQPDNTELLHYQDGVFYVPPSDFHQEHVIRDVTAATKMNDDTYLVTFRDSFFNLMGYMDATQDYGFDPAEYKTAAASDWPQETQHYITQGIPSYAVVKLVDGKVQLPYMGYRNLTEEELESF